MATFIGSATTDVKVDFLYHGSELLPDNAFLNGFKADGTNTDLRVHLEEAAEYYEDPRKSAFVSTSRYKKIAGTYPHALDSGIGFLYEINPQSRGIDVVDALLTTKMNNIRLFDPPTSDMSTFIAEREVAVPFRINNRDIKGGWYIDVEGHPGAKGPYDADAYYEWQSSLRGDEVHTVRDTFIPNPNYIPTPAERVALGLKIGGHGLLAIGAVIDNAHLTNALDQSIQTNSYRPAAVEASRSSASWGAAYALGTTYAKAGATLCEPLGPWGTVGCGFAGGVIGSVIGYTGASATVNALMKDQGPVDERQRAIELQAMNRDFLMSPEAPVSSTQKRLTFMQTTPLLDAQFGNMTFNERINKSIQDIKSNDLLVKMSKLTAGATGLTILMPAAAEVGATLCAPIAPPMGSLVCSVMGGAAGAAIGFGAGYGLVDLAVNKDKGDTKHEALAHLTEFQRDVNQRPEFPFSNMTTGSIGALTEAITTGNKDLGMELFVDAGFIDKKPSLPITTELVKMGARCNREDAKILRRMGSDDVADLCSQPMASPDPKTRRSAINHGLSKFAHVVESAKDINYQTLDIANDYIPMLKGALKDQHASPSAPYLFAWGASIDKDYPHNPGAITNALFNAGARCTDEDEKVLRDLGDHETANLCSLPPFKQRKNF